MDASKKANLIDAGINVDSALERFMGNEKMLEKYFNRFLEEKSYGALLDAIAANDPQTAASSAHMLKSVCGSIGCEQMFKMVVEQESLIKGGKWDEAVAMMPEITTAYEKICAALRS